MASLLTSSQSGKQIYDEEEEIYDDLHNYWDEEEYGGSGRQGEYGDSGREGEYGDSGREGEYGDSGREEEHGGSGRQGNKKNPEIIELEATLKDIRETRPDLYKFRIYVFENCENEVLQNPHKLMKFISDMAEDVRAIRKISPILTTSKREVLYMLEEARAAFSSSNQGKIRRFRIRLNKLLKQILEDIKKVLAKKLNQLRVYNEMKEGDIIEVDRGSYFHYGVVYDVSDPYNKKLIHYGYEKVGFRKARVKEAPFMEVIENHEVKIRNNLCNKPSLPVATIKRRMESKLNQTDYSLLTNNCEHFATWCRYGEKRSNQVRNVHTTTYKYVNHQVKKVRNALTTTYKCVNHHVEKVRNAITTTYNCVKHHVEKVCNEVTTKLTHHVKKVAAAVGNAFRSLLGI